MNSLAFARPRPRSFCPDFEEEDENEDEDDSDGLWKSRCGRGQVLARVPESGRPRAHYAPFALAGKRGYVMR